MKKSSSNLSIHGNKMTKNESKQQKSAAVANKNEKAAATQKPAAPAASANKNGNFASYASPSCLIKEG